MFVSLHFVHIFKVTIIICIYGSTYNIYQFNIKIKLRRLLTAAVQYISSNNHMGEAEAKTIYSVWAEVNISHYATKILIPER